MGVGDFRKFENEVVLHNFFDILLDIFTRMTMLYFIKIHDLKVKIYF